MALWYLGSAAYRKLMIDQAALLVPPVIVEPGNINQIYPQAETYRRIITAEGTLFNYQPGTPGWNERLDLLNVPPILLTLEITAPADGSSPTIGADLLIEATVVGDDDPFSTVFTYDGTDQLPVVGASPSVTIPGVDVTTGAKVISATVTDNLGNTSTDSVTVSPVAVGAVSTGTAVGPLVSYGLTYWVTRSEEDQCLVGFDTGDGDPDPDVWFTIEDVMGSDITQEQKDGIVAQLDAFGCGQTSETGA